MTTTDVATALNRFGLGARADDALPTDAHRWLLAQFDRYEASPPPIAANPGRRAVGAALLAYRERARAFAVAARPNGSAGGQPAGSMPAKPANTAEMAARQAFIHQTAATFQAAAGARVSVAVTTATPFVERMVYFWANHFAVSADRVDVSGFVGPLEFEAIRPHVLGRFGDMLKAVEHHPAMLFYLDQTQSEGPGSVIGQRAAAAHGKSTHGLNENLARETMELHTLGVRSGYTQSDVTEFARALTGWSVAGLGRDLHPDRRDIAGDFVFASDIHEPGARRILGKSYAQDGEAQGQAVLDDLARHPATATHIATKLARHFAGDAPPPALVARLQADFLRTGGDLPSLYRTLIASPEAWAPSAARLKTPWDWLLSAMRALGMTTVDAHTATALLDQLGQPVWKPRSPAGYEDFTASWAGPDAILRRVQIAQRFASHAGTAIDARALAAKILPGSVSSETARVLGGAESPAQALALLLVAPEFIRR